MHIKNIGFCEFTDAFRKSNRGDQFSYDGLKALYDYIQENDPDYNLDVIGLCCTYTEYDNIEDYNKQNCTNYDDIHDTDFLVIDLIDSEGFLVQKLVKT